MGAVKKDVQAMIKSLPDDCSVEDIQYQLYVMEKVRKGMASIEAGKGIPHEEARKRLRKWLSR